MGDVYPVFRSLADPTRRALLDELFARDGQTLVSLTARHDMTRIAVAKHLKILEDAGLVVSRRRGREKLHYLNPVPIRLVHDRWVSKYAEPWAAGLIGLSTYLVAGPVIHAAHGHPGKAGISAALRVGLPVLAWAIGFGVGSKSCRDAYDHEGCPTDYAACCGSCT